MRYLLLIPYAVCMVAFNGCVVWGLHTHSWGRGLLGFVFLAAGLWLIVLGGF